MFLSRQKHEKMQTFSEEFAKTHQVEQLFLAVMHTGFFGWGGSAKWLGHPIFSRVERNFTIGQSPKIWGNFQKYALKLIKIWKIIEKIPEKMQIFRKIF